MLSDGTLTATAGYGSRDGPRPRTLDPAAAPPPADKGGGRTWPAGPGGRQGSLRHHPRPDLTAAAVGRGRHLRLPGRLFAPGSAGVTAPWAGLPGSAAPLGPQTASACQDNAVLPYIRYYGRYPGMLAGVRAGRKTDRETSGSAGTLRRYACRGEAGTCSAGRRPRREQAFRCLASGAGRRLEGDARAFTIPPARPARADRLPAPRRRYSPRL